MATRPLLLTAALGLAGGGLAAALGVPAAWLAGSMAAVAAAALAGLPVGTPPRLRDAAFTLLGVSMGAGVTPETLAQVVAWPSSLAVLAVSVATTLLAGSLYLRRIHGWDPATARYASVPGALAAVIVLAAESEADLPRVVLAQSVRLFALVAVTPSLLTLWGGDAAGPAGPPPAPIVSGPADLVLTLAAGAAAAALLARLRVPGGVLLGAMLASAALHGAGLVHGRPPLAVLIPGFVATGAVIGARFRGTSLAVLRRTLPGAVASVLLALTLSAGFAAGAARLIGLPFDQLWLAYAPGGIEAMAVMALALGADAAFVGAHHVARIVGLNLLNPLWRRPGRS